MRFAQAVAAALTTAGLLAAAPVANAAPTLDPAAGFALSATPGHIAPGPDGNVWFTLPGGAGKEFGRIAPDGTITEFDTAVPHAFTDVASGPSVAGGAHDRIWFAYSGGVYVHDPVSGTGTDHSIPTIGAARGITADADGNIWVVEADGLVKVAPDGTKIDDVPVAGSGGRGIALGSDGRVWWADFGGAAIRATSTAAPYPTATFATGDGPQEIAAGPAGQLGFSNPANQIGRVSTDGTPQQTPDAGTDPFGVAYGADGAYWYAQFATQTIGRLTTDGQYTKPITLPAGSGPRHIAAGPGNTLWVTAETSAKIYRITGVEPPAPEDGGGNGGDGGGDAGDAGGNPGGAIADTIAPVVSGAKVNARRRKLSVRLSEAATVRVVVQQKRARRNGKRYWKSVRKLPAAQREAGRNGFALGKKRFTRGAYRIVLTAKDAAGNSARRTVGFRVR